MKPIESMPGHILIIKEEYILTSEGITENKVTGDSKVIFIACSGIEIAAVVQSRTQPSSH
jgi:hypothetical protein